MELSEAIRIGSAMRPQAFGALFGYTPAYELGDSTLGTCALGAAMDGAGINMGAWNSQANFQQSFPIVHLTASCPACQTVMLQNTRLANIIMHLNDSHRWSRQAIAMWVEVQEKRQEAAREEVERNLREVQAGRVLRETPSKLCGVRHQDDALPGMLANVHHLLRYLPGTVEAGCAADTGSAPGSKEA